MRSFYGAILGAMIVLFVGASAQALTIDLGGPYFANPGDDFDVEVTVTTDDPIAMVQVVLTGLGPNLTLTDGASPLASVTLVNLPDTVVWDYYDDTYPTSTPGTFVAGTLTFHIDAGAGPGSVYDITLFVEDPSAVSTAVFDELYNPVWPVESGDGVVNSTVTVVPEPTSMALLALGLGGIGLCRKKFRK